MRLEKTRQALDAKKVKYSYTEEDGCASLDFLWRGLTYRVWEFADPEPGAETNVFHCGRSEDITGDYDAVIAQEILTWPDMIM